MRIVCQQTIRMEYQTLFRKLEKMSQILSSAVVVIVALRLSCSKIVNIVKKFVNSI